MKKLGTFAVGAALALAAPFAMAQTSTPTTTTPDVPDTGAGGEQAGMMMLLTLSAIAALGGIVYLMRQPSEA